MNQDTDLSLDVVHALLLAMWPLLVIVASLLLVAAYYYRKDTR